MTDTGKLILAIVGTGVAVVGVTGGGLYGMRASVDAFRAEAAADRRAHQSAMDTFRQEMRRLAERQAHVEGRLSAVAATSPSPDAAP